MDSFESEAGEDLPVPGPKLVLGLAHAYGEMTGQILRTLTKPIPVALGCKIRRGMFRCIHLAPYCSVLGKHCTQFVHGENKLIHYKMWECSPLNRPETCTGQKYEVIKLKHLCSCLGLEGGLCKYS